MARTLIQTKLLSALKKALNGEPILEMSEGILQEARQQTVLSLISTTEQALPVYAMNTQLLYEQDAVGEVLRNLHYVILKGTCASIYYPEPLRRTLGDIDILVPPTQFDEAYRALLVSGYQEVYKDDGRHITLQHNRFIIELHHHFACLQTKEQERLLDDLLFNTEVTAGKIGKHTFPMPENKLNGLVLLAHINQHLEEGLGLRQLIDFVMYIKAELSDEKWPAFRKKTDQLGLTILAKVLGKLGQMYFGVDEATTWCTDVNESTVEKLIDYAFECGNFGRKDSANNTITMVLSHGRGFRGFFRNLQRQGENNWKKLEFQPWLKPFAWLYQLRRYVNKGLQTSTLREIRSDLAASRRRNQLLDDLGATRMAYKD